MKKMLFVYTKMVIGGSTTSLLSLLERIDYTHYDVDLLLYEYGGDLFEAIPKQVHILPQAKVYEEGSKKLLMKRFTSISYLKDFALSRREEKRHHNTFVRQQIMSYQTARMCRKLEKEYDVAIGFLEFFPCIYVAHYVKARRKMSWLHIDYKSTGLVPKVDEKTFEQLERVILVSPGCKESFDSCFPQFQHKSIFIENLISGKTLKEMANQPCEITPDPQALNLVTTCRISFSSKGLDRGVMALKALKDRYENEIIHWYIIGDGDDRVSLEALIEVNGLQDRVHLLGKKVNPFPYLKPMDLFFLPSRFEGKPMSVTEAMILEVPPLVTRYTSAPSQVKHLEEGYIVDNTDEGIYEGLEYLLHNREQMMTFKKHLASKDYSNLHVMKQIEKLIEE